LLFAACDATFKICCVKGLYLLTLIVLLPSSVANALGAGDGDKIPKGTRAQRRNVVEREWLPLIRSIAQACPFSSHLWIGSLKLLTSVRTTASEAR
jgi:hypothetical protein